MQRARTWITLSSLIVTAALSSAAHAKSEYVAYIPNGNVKTCENCHPGGDTAKLNLFGNDSSNQVAKPNTEWWPALVDLDSDGDGQTNGQELGDPCGDWLIGLDPPRKTSISNPGDAVSKSADPDNPPCGSGGGGAGGGTVTTTSSTSQTGAGGAPPGGSGQGADIPMSTGAGKADPPVYTTSASCSAAPASERGPARDFASGLGLLIALTLFARSRRTHPR